jgi:hypothetical protein
LRLLHKTVELHGRTVENDLSRLYFATLQWIKLYRRRVRSGFQVADANDFARYVMHSGITDLMKHPHYNAQLKKLFPYDAKHLYDEASKLRMACCDYYAHKTRDSEGTATGPDSSDLEAINQKLNLLIAILPRQQRQVIPATVTPINLIEDDRKQALR